MRHGFQTLSEASILSNERDLDVGSDIGIIHLRQFKIDEQLIPKYLSPSHMRTPRQLQLPLPKSHGGKRKGAGRPNRSGLQAHLKRPVLSPRHPVHVTLKLAPGLPSLRNKRIFAIFQQAVRTARLSGFQVAHFAVLSNHLHLIIEPSEARITRQIQSLCVSFARRLNLFLNASGKVFLDRYHLHVLKTPAETRRALAYVLSNDSRHRGHQSPIIRLDPLSSALAFRDWKRLFKRCAKIADSSWTRQAIESWYSEFLRPPRTWLLREGWTRAIRA